MKITLVVDSTISTIQDDVPRGRTRFITHGAAMTGGERGVARSGGTHSLAPCEMFAYQKG